MFCVFFADGEIEMKTSARQWAGGFYASASISAIPPQRVNTHMRAHATALMNAFTAGGRERERDAHTGGDRGGERAPPLQRELLRAHS